MLKSLTLAVALLSSSAGLAAAQSADQPTVEKYLLVAISDTDDDYVMDADLLHADCMSDLKKFNFDQPLGLYTYGTLVQVKLVDAFCVSDDGGDF